MKRAVLLVSHGSKMAGFDEAINRLVDDLKKQDALTFFKSAFLDVQAPNIPDGIRLCIEQGAEEVIVVPYFVQTGKHVVRDIPRIVEEAKAAHPNIQITLADYLGFDPRMTAMVKERIEQARRLTHEKK